MPATPAPLFVQVDDDQRVSALALAPPDPRSALVLAHGAGAGMTHRFMAALAEGLCDRRIATLRYQFPYMERGSRRPDPPRIAHATVRAAAELAAREWPGLPLFAGGKSFGGRMSSQAQAGGQLPGVRGLVFVGFPLHPAGQPSQDRADHLAQVTMPMLFLQGTRDELADLALITAVATRLSERATLHVVEGADHSFHVLAKSGRSDAQVLAELMDAMAAWMARHAG
jgi:predicted alpha/beta-hydrolase family hydrolase